MDHAAYRRRVLNLDCVVAMTQADLERAVGVGLLVGGRAVARGRIHLVADANVDVLDRLAFVVDDLASGLGLVRHPVGQLLDAHGEGVVRVRVLEAV